MKILHVIASIDPKGGGPSQVIVRLAAAQAQLGNEVHIITRGNAEAESRIAEQTARVPHFADVKVHRVEGSGRLETLFARNARRKIAKLIEGTGFVHLHGVWEPLLAAAADVARGAGVPYCVRPAGMLHPWSLKQRKWKKKIAMAMGTRAMLRHAAFIHTLNRDEASVVESLDFGAPVKVIPNGIFLEELEPFPQRGQFLAAHPELQGRRFVLFLSRLHYKKGLDLLAETFAEVAKKFEDVVLVVAGPDDGEQAPFEQLIAKWQLRERVFVVGAMYGAQKLAAFADAECFCLPSRQEGFSVAVVEALACGAPVVISTECFFPEVAESGCGFVVPLEPPKIAEALGKMLSDKNARDQMSVAAARLIREGYTWPRIAERTLEMYGQGHCAGR